MERQPKAMTKNYLDILEESLIKKESVLDSLHVLSNKQAEVLGESEVFLEVFDQYMDEKDAYLEELDKLDEGFELLYEKIKAELLEHKEIYAEQIERVQQQIQNIMDKSVSLQALESRNKEKVMGYLQNAKKNNGDNRRSSKVAYDYYKSMSRSNVIPSHFMDKKK